jgi:hypothetical protein
MGIRVECDWCREPIEADEAYVTVQIDGFVFKPGRRKAKDVSARARVFCGGGGGEHSCAERLLALLDENPGGPVDMGMEWRLVHVDATPIPGEPRTSGRGGARAGSHTPAPAPVQADADLDAFVWTLAPSSRVRTSRGFERDGISTLEQLDAMTDDEIMALHGVSWKIRDKVREFIAARTAARKKDPTEQTADIVTLESLHLSERTMSVLAEHGVDSLQELRDNLATIPFDAPMMDEINVALSKAVMA